MSEAAAALLEAHRPAFLMCAPFGLAAAVPNNAWMEELSPAARQVDRRRALDQFAALYAFVAARALVYLLPSRPGLQDQAYVSNAGIVLPYAARPTFVSARFRTPVRRGEAPLARACLRSLGFTVATPPAWFEGEADLKHLGGQAYVAAHGLRTSRAAHRWLEERFAMTLIPYRVTDPYLYHLDCSLLPLPGRRLALCTATTEPATLRALERHAEILDVSHDDALSGLTNGLVLDGHLLSATNIGELPADHPDRPYEIAKIRSLEHLAARVGLEPQLFEMGEFYKSGALLSCLFLHLNRSSRAATLP